MSPDRCISWLGSAPRAPGPHALGAGRAPGPPTCAPSHTPPPHLHALLLAVNHGVEGADRLQAALVGVGAADDARHNAVGVRLGVLGGGVTGLGCLVAHGLQHVAKGLADCARGAGGRRGEGEVKGGGPVRRRWAGRLASPCAWAADRAAACSCKFRSFEAARPLPGSYSPEAERRAFDRATDPPPAPPRSLYGGARPPRWRLRAAPGAAGLPPSGAPFCGLLRGPGGLGGVSRELE